MARLVGSTLYINDTDVIEVVLETSWGVTGNHTDMIGKIMDGRLVKTGRSNRWATELVDARTNKVIKSTTLNITDTTAIDNWLASLGLTRENNEIMSIVTLPFRPTSYILRRAN